MEKLVFNHKPGGPFMADISLEAHPGTVVEAVLATRFGETAVIPLTNFPNEAREALLALPPAGEGGDKGVIVNDLLFGRMKCVGRRLKVRFHAEGGIWTAGEEDIYLRTDGQAGQALVGNGIMLKYWSAMLLSAERAEMTLRKSPERWMDNLRRRMRVDER
jgi:hypothetical protein